MPVPDNFVNFAYSTVATAPSPATSGLSLTLAAGDGAVFPTAPFNATVCPAGASPLSTNAEIVRVTAKTGDVLTIVRTQEGTTARTITVGDQIFVGITAKTVNFDLAPPSLRAYENIIRNGITRIINATHFSNTPFFVPFGLDAQLSQMRSISLPIERSAGTSLALTGALAIYSRNTNITQLGLVGSESFNISLSTSALYSGLRFFEFSLSSISSISLSPGHWWLGVYLFPSAGSTALMNINLWGASVSSNQVGSVFIGSNSTGASAQTNQIFDFIGSYSASQASATPFPTNVGQNEISGGGTADSPLLYFQIIP